MRLKNKPVTLSGPGDTIDICRNQDGVPVITAETMPDMAYALGWTHANDRQLQILLTRILLSGRAAECLKNDAALIEVDRYMRRMNLLPDPQRELTKLDSDIAEQLQAYANGFNDYIAANGLVYELRLLGYRYEPWVICDSMLIEKAIGFIGLADAQAGMEKFLIHLIQNDVAEDRLKELFPYLTEPVDYDLIKSVQLVPPLIPEALQWLSRLPRFNASNNWAVSGRLTASGYPILCGDPHLEVNRLPAIWYEAIVHLPDNRLMGGTIPGMPGIGVGRSNHVAWSATYAFMDMLDYRIEECREGCYKREDGWKPFDVREEVIKVKKGAPLKLVLYENEHGILEGDPHEPGRYLTLGWSAHRGCGAADMNCLMRLPNARNVSEMMSLFKGVEAVAFNWVMADTDGNIGFQMSGRCYARPSGVSGLLATPGWDKAYDPQGFVPQDKLPSSYNPPDGIIVTANEDLNHLGKAAVINLPMGTYRSDRIKQLLGQTRALDGPYMQQMHYDLYSLQAERLMTIIDPLLPDTPNGRILKAWDLRYKADSKGAMLFESVYRALIYTIFGDNTLGPDVVDHVFKETGLFNDYYANLDNILLRESSAWFGELSRKALFTTAITEGLSVEARPYGTTRQVMMAHLLFGGQLPRWAGFDYGPISLPGSRATIPQGQIFKSAGRVTTFSPSYRLIADMATLELHTNLAGGPSDRRFSRWYTTDIENWLAGKYKVLT